MTIDQITSCFGPLLIPKGSIDCLSPAWWLSAKWPDPIPSRTRPSNASAPMVLCLKTRESRSPPGLQKTIKHLHIDNLDQRPKRPLFALLDAHPRKAKTNNAGWSSPVARQAHNLKVTGSNPVPATISTCDAKAAPSPGRLFAFPPPNRAFWPVGADAMVRMPARSPRTSMSRRPSAFGVRMMASINELDPVRRTTGAWIYGVIRLLLSFKIQAAFWCFCCGYVVNALALSK